LFVWPLSYLPLLRCCFSRGYSKVEKFD